MSTLSRTINKINTLEGVLATPAVIRIMSATNQIVKGATAQRPIECIGEFRMEGLTKSAIFR